MTSKIKEYMEKRAALLKRSEESTDLKELEIIQKQLSILNDALEALRAAQKDSDDRENGNDDDEEDSEDDEEEEDRGVSYRRAKAALRKREKSRQERGENSPKYENPSRYIPGKGFIPAEESRNTSLCSELERREKAGVDLKEKRAVNSALSIFGELRAVTVTPASGQAATIVVPSTVSSTINPDFTVVSSLVDSVQHLSLDGGDTFKQGYVTGIDTGNYTAEAGNAASAETHFDYAEIHKTKITAYAEISEELEKLPAAPYADLVFQNIRTSMRKLLSREILVGAGGTNQIVGIFSSQAKAIDAATDIGFSQITDTTLDEIVFKYGGDEEVEDAAVLILNKLDLMAFSKVRTSTKQQFYDIQVTGNSGTINGVPFIINSACKSLTAASGDSAAAVGDYCMAYGSLSGYLLAEFSPMVVVRSDDYKFANGMPCFRGGAWFGGNVVRKNAFLRVKKSAS